MRKLVKGNVACPLIFVGIAGNGDFATAFLSNGDVRGHDVSDVAVHIGVHGVLPRAPNVFHDG